VIHFDTSGKPVDQVAAAGDLARPLEMTVDANGVLYVADAAANQVVANGP